MVIEAGAPVFLPSEKASAEAFERRTGRTPTVLTQAQIRGGVSVIGRGGRRISRSELKAIWRVTQIATAKKAAEEAARKSAEEAARKAAEEAARKAAEERAREQKLLLKRLRTQKYDKQIIQDALILQRKQQLKEEAERRGKSFTRLEAERFLRPAGGVGGLRSATAREQQRFKKGEPTIKEILPVTAEAKRIDKLIGDRIELLQERQREGVGLIPVTDIERTARTQIAIEEAGRKDFEFGEAQRRNQAMFDKLTVDFRKRKEGAATKLYSFINKYIPKVDAKSFISKLKKQDVLRKVLPSATLISILKDPKKSIEKKQRDIAKIKNLPADTISLIKKNIPEGTFERFIRGFQKVAVTERFRSKDIREEQDKKIKDLRKKIDKEKRIDLPEEITKSFEDKDVATFAKITGGAIGVINPIMGASMWAVGDIGARAKKLREEKEGVKVTKGELGRLVVTGATKGAIMGFLMKVGGKGMNIAGKKMLTKVATKKIENTAMRSAVNHGGQLLKVTGTGGKNLITTYFYKDIAGDIFEVTADVKNKKFDNAIRKTAETGGAIGGFIGGAKLGGAAVKGALVATGRYKPTIPEIVQKKIPADVMARQLLKKGRLVLTRRGVWGTGRGLVPRKDAWADPDIKVPTKGIFWRFDKTLDKKGDAISSLPLFTKDKSKYWTMFKKNWEKNKGMGLIKRYIKTTAETPVVDDIMVRRVINIKDIKDTKLRDTIIKEFATTGKLTKATQNQVLKKKLSFSDKNRERGFHDENEFVTRKVVKLQNKKDISWTYDPILKEYIPVVQNLKEAGRIKNFLTVLRKKKIITKTDAQYIKDNFAIKKKFREKAILPKGHSFNHMKNVKTNIGKLMDKYPQFNKYWKKKYGSVKEAKTQLKKAMWHDIGKTSESSVEFGTAHGQKVWNVWKAGLLPKGIKLKKGVAKAIRVHESLDPRKIRYKIKNKIGIITPEEKIVATADRLDLARYNIKIDIKKLPLKDAISRLKLDIKVKEYPSKFNTIISKIKSGEKVTKQDIKKLLAWKPKEIKPRPPIKPPRRVVGKPPRPPVRPPIRPPIRPPTRPPRAPPRRPPRKPPKRIPEVKRRPPRKPPRPPVRPPKRPPKRPPGVPPRRPPRKPPRPPIIPRIKKRIPKKKPVRPRSFEVWARPLKKKGQKKPKLIKVSKVPLSKKRAKDLRNYITDTSLGRTARIKPSIGKPTEPKLKTPKGYARITSPKFRRHRIVKGKRIPLTKGRVIERGKFLLDTTQEKKQITLKRRIAQLSKPPKRKTIKRRSSPKRSGGIFG